MCVGKNVIPGEVEEQQTIAMYMNMDDLALLLCGVCYVYGQSYFNSISGQVGHSSDP